ncbi:MAG: diguanylate cyclase [Novosphingobium sp.]|nr:diguanylate cyclase [Novosphingobium sp.]
MVSTELLLRKLERAHRQVPIFIASIAGLAVLMIGSSWTTIQTAAAQQEEASAYMEALETLHATDAVEMAVLNAIRGERGYVLTRNPDYLEPFNSGVRNLRVSVDRLDQLAVNDADRTREIAALRERTANYLEAIGNIVALEGSGRHQAAIAEIRKGDTRATINDITSRLDAIEESQRTRLSAASARLVAMRSSQLRFIWLTTAAGVSLLVFASLVIVALRRAFAREAAYRDELRRLANTDALTGVANRRELNAALERAISAARRNGEQLAFAIFDIDHFKRVNDGFGHPAGDEVIRQTAARALVSMRGCDVVGRLGGEEFAIVLPGAGLSEAYAVCERLRQSVLEWPVELEDGRSVTVTISTGVAGLLPGDTAELLTARADQALYEAKHAGRDQVRLAA